MKSFKVNKNTLMSFRVFGLIIGVSFMVIGAGMFAPKIQAVGQVPTECVNITNVNVKNTYYCNPACTRTNCISYCPAYNGGSHIKVPFTMTNLQIKYTLSTRPVYIEVPGTTIANWVNCGSNGCTGVLTDTSGKVFKKGDVLKIIVKDREGYAIGFRSPDANNICGEDNICREDGGKNGNPRTYETFSLASAVVPSEGYQLVSKQCYGDTPRGDSDFDFNDYGLVVFGQPISCGGISPKTKTIYEGESVTFTCPVTNAKKCIMDGKEIQAKNGKCTYTKTFDKAGTYKVTCKLPDMQNPPAGCESTIIVKKKADLVCNNLQYYPIVCSTKKVYGLTCSVSNAEKCVFDIDGKKITADVVDGKCKTQYEFSNTGTKSVTCYAVKGDKQVTSNACKKDIAISDNMPICKDITVTSVRDKDRTYTFRCDVQNANTCTFKVGKKKYTKPITDGYCTLTYTFANSGDYNVSCDAQYDDKTSTCSTLVHIPTDSAGDYVVPFVIAIVLGVSVLVPFRKRILENLT